MDPTGAGAAATDPDPVGPAPVVPGGTAVIGAPGTDPGPDGPAPVVPRGTAVIGAPGTDGPAGPAPVLPGATAITGAPGTDRGPDGPAAGAPGLMGFTPSVGGITAIVGAGLVGVGLEAGLGGGAGIPIAGTGVGPPRTTGAGVSGRPALGFATGGGGSCLNNDIARRVDSRSDAGTAGSNPIRSTVRNASKPAYTVIRKWRRVSMSFSAWFGRRARSFRRGKGSQFESRLNGDMPAFHSPTTHFNLRDIDDTRQFTDAIEEEG